MHSYPICPVAKPRMTRSDKWKKRPATAKYWNFKDRCKAARVKLPIAGAQVIFILPMPASWSKTLKDLMNGAPHKQRPDLDNLLKALQDAIYGEDSEIWDVHITKLWGREGRIVIRE